MTEEQNTLAPLPTAIGRYAVKRLLGKGGMGEVYLTFDPICQRLVALKKIRDDLLQYEVLRERFLKEAKIAAQFCHPSIIPVHEIHHEEDLLCYTMPYIEGNTLKSILRETRKREKQGEPPHPIGVSVNNLMRIFLQICEAVSYCHSRKLLHRDLKPENILIGEFGEVLILDWGLAEHRDMPSSTELDAIIIEPEHTNLTRPGKVVGTLSYLAPERVDGAPADEHTDIYSLGVILYQMLTLRLPFHRKTLKEYRKVKKHEMLIDALEAAPLREIPPQLSEMAKKCLAFDCQMRYPSVNELIIDVKAYIKGDPKWVFAAVLNKNSQNYWEFQENVLLTRLNPIARNTTLMEWGVLMISKEAFTGNTQVSFTLVIKKESTGMGILLSIPKPTEKDALEEGYCIWIGGPKKRGIRLIRANIVLKTLSDYMLSPDENHEIIIQRVDHHIHLFIDGDLVFTYTNYIPFVGSHLGLLYKDTHFSIDKIDVHTGAYHVMVNCLSIPDAFLSAKNFEQAFIEYSRIANSFRGRVEGKEALFRAGITLIESAKIAKTLPEKERYLREAEEMFTKLDQTLGSPLEHLGKAMIYQIENNPEEEIKCLALAIRKFPKHPLINTIEEHIIFRLTQTAKNQRLAAYELALITVLHLSHRLTRELKNTLSSLIESLEEMYFLHWEEPEVQNPHLWCARQGIILAFWLNKPLILEELITHVFPHLHQGKECIERTLYALLHLDENTIVKHWITKDMGNYAHIPFDLDISQFPLYLDTFFHEAPTYLDAQKMRAFFFLAQKGLEQGKFKPLVRAFAQLEGHDIPAYYKMPLDVLKLWTYLAKNDFNTADLLLKNYSMKELVNPRTPFFFLYGCYLSATKGYHLGMHHFKVMREHAFPPLSSLIAYYLSGYIDFKGCWSKQAFSLEKSTLLKQLALFYNLGGKKARAVYFSRKLKRYYD